MSELLGSRWFHPNKHTPRKVISSDDECSPPALHKCEDVPGNMKNDNVQTGLMLEETPTDKQLATSLTLPDKQANDPGEYKPTRSMSSSFDFDGKMEYYKSLNVRNIMRSMSVSDEKEQENERSIRNQFSIKRKPSTKPDAVPIKDGEREYIAKEEDTLAGIAVKHGVSVPVLVKHNRMSSANLLSGMRIIIPSSETIAEMARNIRDRKRGARATEIEATEIDTKLNKDEAAKIPEEITKLPVTLITSAEKSTTLHESVPTYTVSNADIRSSTPITTQTPASKSQVPAYGDLTNAAQGKPPHSPAPSIKCTETNLCEDAVFNCNQSNTNADFSAPDRDCLNEQGGIWESRCLPADESWTEIANGNDFEYRAMGGYDSLESLEDQTWREIKPSDQIGDTRELVPCCYYFDQQRVYGMLKLGEPTPIRTTDKSPAGKQENSSDVDTQIQSDECASDSTSENQSIHKYKHKMTYTNKHTSIGSADAHDSGVEGFVGEGEDAVSMVETSLMFFPLDRSTRLGQHTITIPIERITGLSIESREGTASVPSKLEYSKAKYGFFIESSPPKTPTVLSVLVRNHGMGAEHSKHKFDIHPDNLEMMYSAILKVWQCILDYKPVNKPGVELGGIQDKWDSDDLFALKPDLIGTSRLVDENTFHQLRLHLPEKVKYNDWVMLFNTSSCGFSLNALYRQVKSSGPNIIILRDSGNAVFGAYLSEPLRVSETRYFGSGECFVFTLAPIARVYPWTGLEDFFISATLHSFSIGAGDNGVPAIWLDENLLHGASGPTTTYNNPILSYAKEFRCMELEVWGFA
eukprot:CFRG0523T1